MKKIFLIVLLLIVGCSSVKITHSIKLEGLHTGWYENGQKKEEITYKNGKRNGKWTLWYENGQKKLEGTYKYGEEDGLWIWWYENGQQMSEVTWKDGEEISKKEWNRDGSVKE